jgi:hypothetical protein
MNSLAVLDAALLQPLDGLAMSIMLNTTSVEQLMRTHQIVDFGDEGDCMFQSLAGTLAHADLYHGSHNALRAVLVQEIDDRVQAGDAALLALAMQDHVDLLYTESEAKAVQDTLCATLPDVEKVRRAVTRERALARELSRAEDAQRDVQARDIVMKKYLRHLSKSRSWGGGAVLYAAAARFGVAIQVVSSDAVAHCYNPLANRWIGLFYTNGNHYQGLLPLAYEPSRTQTVRARRYRH